jgi:hypothetical protein
MQAGISKVIKGEIFLAELKRRLFLDGFIVAKPEPDIGDDLWVLDGGVFDVDSGELDQSRLIRCQLKSAANPTPEGAFTINVTRTCRFIKSERYYFIIGIWDNDLERFHVGYFPSRFFLALKVEGRIRLNKQGRHIFDFFVGKSGAGHKFELRLKYPPRCGRKRGRGPRMDVTEYFNKDGLRAAIKSNAENLGKHTFHEP